MTLLISRSEIQIRDFEMFFFARIFAALLVTSARKIISGRRPHVRT